MRLGGEELPLPKGNLAPCRCGGSQKKPFCNGTPKALGFQAEAGEVEASPDQGQNPGDPPGPSGGREWT